MPEIILHYIWEHCLWAGFEQETTDGRKVEILSVGEHNHDAGPDYSHARIRIDGHEWVGNIEIHINSSDWVKHRHHLDKAYDNIILHVVRTADKPVYNSRGELIPQCELQYPGDQDYVSGLLTAAKQMDSAAGRIGCAEQLLNEPGLITEGWRQTLLRKRLECKRASIQRLLEITKGSWEHALYISLARNFGFHTNSVPFEELAINTPLSYLQKHRNSLFQLTAILMGQAGLIEKTSTQGEEKNLLLKEYQFMQAKFGLVPLDASVWKHARMRPQNSPEVRIRQFAQLLYQSEALLSKILDTNDSGGLVSLFELKGDSVPPLGRNSIDILLINTVIPYKYAYALHINNTGKAEEMLRLMEQIAPENNSIIRQWRILGQRVKNAADTQALLHLYMNYCQHHECINCEVGYKIFQDKQLKLF
ncbi:MAG: DUF2851 family protein [Paludibacteraceae bacterium]|nr:DUF2851 family protein [Paludibacteraceae bacterium]MBQ6764702.1 DUF2851 family protein [Paludibacteraceae bacterium]